ncbi:exported hypothetical protein [Marinoscillum sp. 108]|nr:exported hypothetical protein [Marinoscillum sp. 108]
MKDLLFYLMITLLVHSAYAQESSYTVNKGSGYARLRIESDGDGTHNNVTNVIESYGYGGASDLNFMISNWNGHYHFAYQTTAGSFNAVRLTKGGGGSNGPNDGYGLIDVYGRDQSNYIRLAGYGDSFFKGSLVLGGTSTYARLELLSLASQPTMLVGRANGYPNIMASTDGTGHLIMDSRSNAYASLNHYSSADVTLAYGGGNVGVGVVHPTEKLEVKGTIRSKEVKVEASPWPDYVFSEGYELPDLGATADFIKANKHLPGIPSAAEVADQGILLGEMNAKLLEKIEELTLHLIEKDKQIDLILERLEAQEGEIDQLKKQ